MAADSGTGAGQTDAVPLLMAFLVGPLLLGAGLLIAAVAVKGWRGDLVRNRLVGVRTPATLASDEAWLVAHRIAGPWMLAGSLGAVVPGAVLLFRPSNGTATVIIMIGLAVMVALVIAGGAIGSMAAGRLNND